MAGFGYNYVKKVNSCSLHFPLSDKTEPNKEGQVLGLISERWET